MIKLKNMQTGSALVTALLVTAIVAAIATVMALKLRIAIREAQLSTVSDRAYLDLQGVPDWAIAVLINDAKTATTATVELFPKKMPTINFYGAQITGQLDDQQGLFNINALSNPNNALQFVRLLRAVNPDLNNQQAMTLTKAIADWLTPTSAADTFYMTQRPPYRAAHMLMSHISELRLVNGISSQLYRQLAPYLAALPNATNEININSVTAPVLMTLADNLTLDQAQAVISCRDGHGGFSSTDEFTQQCLSKLGVTIDPAIKLVTTSQFFLVRGLLTIGNQTVNLTSQLKRVIGSAPDGSKKITVNPLWESLVPM